MQLSLKESYLKKDIDKESPEITPILEDNKEIAISISKTPNQLLAT